ncbi:uncharacterized protein KY384_003363 [Bacidia gigantensis]|uniref:uncharacterized protein n=1 Tax=Bacidia gigantensis TaxID=2732470 RepID=UPI001D03D968|nr:uncharacterized protein KY384_003363 [Bacidia gigantensis]KAG8531731.1 hypothetical protein KY384_003363 [Bacidia gigantensis]
MKAYNRSLTPDGLLPNGSPFISFKDQLASIQEASSNLSPLTPIRASIPPLASMSTKKPTHLMAVLNLTPDSFSDGGLHSSSKPEIYVNKMKQQAQQNRAPTLVDIGGQSTRPYAKPVSPEEELSRIIPSIQAIRAESSLDKIAISVDTYRASVARAAIAAGADIINDVSAGQLDKEMLRTIAELGCTCILMHMRGTPETMNSLTKYPDGVIQGVGSELLERVRAAEQAGIRRWRIILDPGIGFAKNQAQNLEILQKLNELRNFEGLQGFPWVVGASRKKFIGKITGVEEPRERVWGTAACVVSAVQGGADIVRVHDVEEMGQAVKMADAIWRA